MIDTQLSQYVGEDAAWTLQTSPIEDLSNADVVFRVSHFLNDTPVVNVGTRIVTPPTAGAFIVALVPSDTDNDAVGPGLWWWTAERVDAGNQHLLGRGQLRIWP